MSSLYESRVKINIKVREKVDYSFQMLINDSITNCIII
jgi:hypothetical protein